MNLYWDERFANDGMIWGTEPSPTVVAATAWFRQYDIHTVLVPGAGYGRNTKALSEHFKVTGLELSMDAIELATGWDTTTTFVQGSALQMPVSSQLDGVYCYDLLHLFQEKERKELIQQCVTHTKQGGIMYFTCFSDEDLHHGKGRRIEEGTYEYMPNKFAHFFSEDDLLMHFSELNVLEIGTIDEELHYDAHRSKKYRLRYIVAQNM